MIPSGDLAFGQKSTARPNADPKKLEFFSKACQSPRPMNPPSSLTILHLSDMHFGRLHRFEREGLGSLLSRIQDDLHARMSRFGLKPDLVVLSGDFAEFGKRTEFDQALAFVQGLRDNLDLPARRFVMVPGNHDVNWNKSRAYFENQAGDDLPAVEPYFPKFDHYKAFFDAFYKDADGIAFSEAEPFSFFEIPELLTVVAGLNSAFAESHRDEDHHAFLGEAQLRAFAGKLRPFKEQGYLRIGVMHHDPFDKRGGPKADQDQKDFRRILVPELNLLLHGDIHEETKRYLDRNVPAIGVGSAAVGVSERGPDISNEYQWLVLRQDGIDRYLRAWVSDQKRWIASPRADDRGESEKTFVEVDFKGLFMGEQPAAPKPAIDLSRVVAQYRQAMTKNQGAPSIFDLLGLGDDGAGSGGLDFLKLFVQPYVSRAWMREEREPRMGRDEEGDIEALRARLDRREEEQRRWDRPSFGSPQALEDILGDRLLLILGGPGAGKSALTRWLILKLCVPGERLEQIEDTMVPVRIELGRYDQERRRREEAGGDFGFLEYSAREKAEGRGGFSPDVLKTLAGEGKVLWLLDGLDEIGDVKRRQDVARRIAHGLGEEGYKECRAIVTSRWVGSDSVRPILEGGGFGSYRLEDFSAEQRDRFLDAWHALIFKHDGVLGESRRARIGAAIEAAPSLQELCKNPLLCSMLAYLNREETLPQKRHRLYQKVLERMAEHWDANKDLPARPGTERFDLDMKLELIRGLAWRMQTDPATSGNAIGRGALEEFCQQFFEKKWGQAWDAARRSAEALIDQLHGRNGILSDLGSDTFGFAHRAMMEYSAAYEAVERYRGRRWELLDLGKVFAEHWEEAGWEETLLLICGLLQEDREEGELRVVRMLQAIGEGRAAYLYGKLDDYVVFCIKALGELPQLEKGAPGEFARGINEILLRLVDYDQFLVERKLPEGFRRCSGRWPGVRELVRATMDERRPAWLRVSAWVGWIAAGGQALRLELIQQALPDRNGPFFSLWQEAARLGPWSHREMNEALDLCAQGYEYDQLAAAGSIASTVGSHWKDSDRPIALLWHLARNASNELIQIRSAATLLNTHHYVDEAKAILLGLAHSTTEDVASYAVLSLVQAHCSTLVLEPLAQFACRDGAAFVELAKVAQQLPSAKSRLRDALESIRKAEDPERLPRIAFSSMLNNLWFFSEHEILDRLGHVKDETLRAVRIDSFHAIPGTQILRAKAWLAYWNDKPKDISILIQDVIGMDVVKDCPELVELWKRIFAQKDPWTAIRLAKQILRLQVGGELEAIALRVRDWVLSKDASEGYRLQAAQNFRHSYAPAQQVLEELAQTANDKNIRYNAARFTGNLNTLNQLLSTENNETLRNLILHTLKLYAEINALLRIQKPRKAKVRFMDQTIGTLEELQNSGHGTVFRYLPDYKGPPISPTLPVHHGNEYKDEHTLLPFFANLLPEGPLYEQTARRLGLKSSDRFGVLLKVGADTMGALEILPEEPE